ncbi:Heavy-metal resistance protein CzcE [Noviherbaspirillum humi]|uniref:Heavy-metal resistance protein CzcE n=1 Tax=Noviherbaspirillum humi TaxID=1688639 RepID=A0A239LKA6_9BURK|nr:CzcE family metal-binding protein [Noviherbaspirillum humi]SNT30825.1 Heavy-metal resistance protein CzcE [Noviherbaspirillum humi]
MILGNPGRFLPPALLGLALLSGCASPTIGPDFYGAPAAVSQINRTIAIHPDTRWVNAEGGETINFVTPGGTFAWQFFATAPRRFDLNFVAPPGMLDHRVEAFISPDRRYIGSGDRRK